MTMDRVTIDQIVNRVSRGRLWVEEHGGLLSLNQGEVSAPLDRTKVSEEYLVDRCKELLKWIE